MCVRDQARLYYRLLHCGIDETRKILLGRRSDPSLGVLIGRPTAPVSQWAPYFNTLEPLRQDGAAEAEPASREKPQHVTSDPKASSHLPDSLSSHMAPGQPGEAAPLLEAAPAVLQPPSEGTALRRASSPPLTPEEFERTWLQLQRLPAAHGKVAAWDLLLLVCRKVTPLLLCVVARC